MKILYILILSLLSQVIFADCYFDTQNQNKLDAKKLYDKAKTLSLSKSDDELQEAIHELRKAMILYSKLEKNNTIIIDEYCTIYRYGINKAFKQKQTRTEIYDYDYPKVMRRLKLSLFSEPVIIVQFIAENSEIGNGNLLNTKDYQVSVELINAGSTILDSFAIIVYNQDGTTISVSPTTLLPNRRKRSSKIDHMSTVTGVTISSHEKAGLNMYKVEQ